MWETFSQCQGYVHQGDQNRHLDQGSDNAGQRLSGGGAVGGDRDRDGKLKVVAGGRESQRRRAFVAQADGVAQCVPAAPHDGEVGQQR